MQAPRAKSNTSDSWPINLCEWGRSFKFQEKKLDLLEGICETSNSLKTLAK